MARFDARGRQLSDSGAPWPGTGRSLALHSNYRQGSGAGGRRLRRRWPVPDLPQSRLAGYPLSNDDESVDPAAGTETVVCNLVCDHGETVRTPCSIRRASRSTTAPFPLPLRTKEGKSRGINSPFEVNNLSLDQRQPLVIEQPRRKLGKFLRVYAQKGFAPFAHRVSRADDGRDRSAGGRRWRAPFWNQRRALFAPPRNFSPQFPAIVCGPDGRFEYTGLPSGAKVEFRAIGTAVEFLQFFGRMDVKPGKTVDLGDIKLEEPQIGQAGGHEERRS